MRALLRRLSLVCLAACQGSAGAVVRIEPGDDVVLQRVDVEGAPPESEGHPIWRGHWVLADGRRVLQDAEGVFLDGEQVGVDPTSAVVVSADGRRLAFSDRVDGDPVTRLVGCERRCRPLVVSGHPDRVALSPDGEFVAYVAGFRGLPAVFLKPFDGGEARQLTNVGLHRMLPGEPLGFVPPPQGGPLRFDGSDLVWTAEGQEHRVAWR